MIEVAAEFMKFTKSAIACAMRIERDIQNVVKFNPAVIALDEITYCIYVA